MCRRVLAANYLEESTGITNSPQSIDHKTRRSNWLNNIKPP